MDPTAQQVWDRMLAVYAGFLAQAPDQVDLLLDPDMTLWDSAEIELVHGLSALRELRSRRPAATPGSPQVADIIATDPVIDVWGDIALVRHRLTVVFDGDRPDESIRNTSVWRRSGDQWFAVHNHEDVLPAGSGRIAGRPVPSTACALTA